MNVSDTEIAWSILKQNGFLRTTEIKEVNILWNHLYLNIYLYH